MSRCFPYPPPGYTLSRASKEALIESIELQKAKEKTKEQRKEKRKEKKEKRKEKKDKSKDKKDRRKDNHEKLTNNSEKYDNTTKCRIVEKPWADSKGVSLRKLGESETEVLEKSSLSEEHGQPISLPVPSTSSESTETSNKRKRNYSPGDDTRAHGNIIRIKLSSKKQHVSDTSIDEQRLCSTSGRTDAAPKNKIEFFLGDGRKDILGTGKMGPELELRTDGLICPTSGKIEPVAPAKTAPLTSMQKRELQYKNLFENWVPPPLQQDVPPLDSDDSDWLFQSKKSGSRVEKRQRVGSESLLCSSNSTSWPCALYLPDVDVYALPFTVPF